MQYFQTKQNHMATEFPITTKPHEVWRNADEELLVNVCFVFFSRHDSGSYWTQTDTAMILN